MIAILSDIHGNLEALEAVLTDAVKFDIDAIYSLGDLIGYGPDPIQCLEIAMSFDVVLRGNFEHAVMSAGDLPGWGTTSARDSVIRFRSRLDLHSNRQVIAEFLASLPTHLVTSDAFYVHGTARNHLHEYLFPEDIYNPKKMHAVTSLFESVCFCGHTHIPGIYHQVASEPRWEFFSPPECDHRYSYSGGKLICNVGSVGQPRDGDRRACYVLFTPGTILFRRVEYDNERTIRKIRDDDNDDFSAQRLRDGR